MSVATAKRLAVESRSIAGTNGKHVAGGNGSVKRSMQRPSSTSKRSDSSARTVKEISAWIRSNTKGGMDALAASPSRALRMGLDVALAADLIARQQHDSAVAYLDSFLRLHADSLNAADRVCRTGMNARKRGELPSASSLPGAKAAATRRTLRSAGRASR